MVKLTFHKYSTNSRFLDESSSSNIINLRRISEIHTIINILTVHTYIENQPIIFLVPIFKM